MALHLGSIGAGPPIQRPIPKKSPTKAKKLTYEDIKKQTVKLVISKIQTAVVGQFGSILSDHFANIELGSSNPVNKKVARILDDVVEDVSKELEKPTNVLHTILDSCDLVDIVTKNVIKHFAFDPSVTAFRRIEKLKITIPIKNADEMDDDEEKGAG